MKEKIAKISQYHLIEFFLAKNKHIKVKKKPNDQEDRFANYSNIPEESARVPTMC